MRTGFDVFRGFNSFFNSFDLFKHLFKALFISVFLWNRKLLDYLVIKIFDFCFKNRDVIFHNITLIIRTSTLSFKYHCNHLPLRDAKASYPHSQI